jgi:hypothetical protein
MHESREYVTTGAHKAVATGARRFSRKNLLQEHGNQIWYIIYGCEQHGRVNCDLSLA